MRKSVPVFFAALISVWFLSPVVRAGAQTNVLTYHNDNTRTGQNLNETLLTLSNVNSTNFGKLGFLSVDGKVDAQPLYVSNLTVAGSPHNVVFIVTEHDSVYAFDADTLAQLWKVTVLGSGETTSDDHGCGQVTPEIGITSTPVIDLSAGPNGTIFVVAMSKDNFGNYHQRLHALDVTTGAELSGSPKEIQAIYPTAGGGTTTFAPGQYKERAGLLLLNGVVYTSWASHCDIAPYSGWVIGYGESTLQQASVFNFTPNGSEGSVWMSGAGPAADSLGNIYFLAANGTFDTSLNANGFPVNGDYGNAFMKLSTSGNSLSVADYFTMHNTVAESNADQDLGSGGALLLPDLTDSLGNTWHLSVGAGKDSIIYVVNRDSMGKFNPTSDNIYQEISANGLAGGSGVYAMPAYFNGTLYYGAVNDSLKAFTIANARVVTPPSSNTASTFAYPGTTPSISANGTSNGIVWAVQNSGGTAILHAYDATNLANELYNSNQAGTRDQFSDNKFITPMVANGKVFVGTPTGAIVFGLLSGGTPRTLSSISVTPANPSIAKGATQQFTATGTFSDGSTQNLTSTATWSSSNTAVATINSAGLASAVGTGSTTIQTISGSVSGSTTLTVPAPAGQATAYVQSASGNDNYNTASASAKFSSNVTANDAIAVFCVWGSLSQTLNSVTDTQGNTFTLVANPTNGGYGRAAMAYAIARSSGSDTVSCNFSSASIGKSIIVHEISGVNTSTPLDGQKMNVQNSPGGGTNAITSGSITTTVNGDYILGFTFNDSANQADWNAGTGHTKRQDLQVQSYAAASEDKAQTLSGSVAATFTATAATFGRFITGIMAFRPSPRTAPTLLSIAVTPANPSIAKGTTQQFTATGTYSDGSTQNLTSTASWSSSNTAVATVNSTGLTSGVGTGASTIQAASGSVTGSTTLTVTAAVLSSIAVTPANPSIVTGATQPFTATGSYSDGTTQNLTSTASWSSSNTAVATINSIGVSSGLGTGTTTIQAASAGISGSATLTVTGPLAISVAVSPTTANALVGGGTQQFTAAVTNDAQNLGVTWSLSGAGCSGTTCGALSASSSASGTAITYTAPASAPTPATVALTATSVSDNTRAASATITITLNDTASMYIDFESATDGTTITTDSLVASTHCGNGLWSLEISPITGMTISASAQKQLPSSVTTCGTQYTDASGTRGLQYDMSQTDRYAAYNWSTLSSSASVGFFYKITLSDQNYYTVFAMTAGGGGDYAALHIRGGAMYLETVTGVSNPTPISPNVWYWVTMQYNAGGTHYMQVYDGTTWALLGSVSRAASGNYNPTGIEVGRTGNEPGYPSGYWYYDEIIVDYLTAKFPIVPGTPPSLVSIAVTPANPSVANGLTQQFTATGTYSDGSTQNLTGAVNWSSSNTAVAAVIGSGVASGVGVGASTIQAASGSVTGSTTLTVTAPVLSSIAVTPANPSIAKGATQQFTATGTYTDGSAQNLTSTVAWSSSNTTVATINSAGLATSVTTGTSTIQAALGPVIGSTTLTVTAVLSSIVVTPANPSIAKGTTQQFTATGTFSDGSTQVLTRSVGWTSSNTSVATINNSGLASGAGTGTSTIQAASGSVTGSTTLNVTAAVLSSIAITPTNPSIAKGATQQFTATGTFGDGSTQNLTSTATWSSSNTAVATINSAGLASAVGTGSTTIQAISGSVSASTTLTVTTSVSTTPAYVQSASGNDHYSTSSASAKFPSNVTANDAIAVFCVWESLSQTLSSVTDTQGNTFTIVANPTSGGYGRAAMAYAIARSTGGDTVSCNLSTASMGKSIIVHEISGVNTSTPLDGQKVNVQNSPGGGANAVTSGSITTTANGAYILGFTFNDSANQADWNAGTGYTKRQGLQIQSYAVASEDKAQTLSGSVAATFTATAAGFGDFITGIIAFRPR